MATLAELKEANKVVIEHDGEQWSLSQTGYETEEAVYCVLASLTRGRQQKNGWIPAKIVDEVSKECLEAAGWTPDWRPV